jgi:hypothetical protein
MEAWNMTKKSVVIDREPRSNSISNRVHDTLWKKSRGKCWYCGIDLSNSNITVDHVHPKYAGGNNSEQNLVYSCRSCNSSKGRKNIETYRIWVSHKTQGIPFFNEQQMAFLEQNGFDTSVLMPKNHLFFGEMCK